MLLNGCRPALKKEAKKPEDALFQVKYFYPHFTDDMDYCSLVGAVNNSLEYLRKLDPEYIFKYGSNEFTCQQVIQSQELFLKILKDVSGPEELNKKIKKYFNVYEATGRVGSKSVLFTGYFEPTYDARLVPDENYKYPVYRLPNDLVKIDLTPFSEKFKGESIIARIDGKKVIPYYSRKEIEDLKVFKNRNLAIAWLKSPIDVAFLQIQGSGRLRLSGDKYITVGYVSSNGRPYNSIGKYLIENGYMTKDEMSMQGIRQFLSQHPDIMNDVLNYNPSYVFFRVLENGPLGNIGVPITPGRTIALDSDLFPEGAICFIKCKKPVVDSNGQIKRWVDFSRFVLNQDTGGAIKGAGRADIFWGSGKYAKLAAGYMRQEGELYVLIKKPGT